MVKDARVKNPVVEVANWEKWQWFDMGSVKTHVPHPFRYSLGIFPGADCRQQQSNILAVLIKRGIHLEQVAFLTERQCPLPDIPAQA
ncbi:MAG: hypothetical protein C4B58_08660 [Deltaproteobacteria bacterium]|nr:MAG: hypothetical protein C4B58_08660 [Deltaproteobacteria bacterium]